MSATGMFTALFYALIEQAQSLYSSQTSLLCLTNKPITGRKLPQQNLANVSNKCSGNIKQLMPFLVDAS